MASIVLGAAGAVVGSIFGGPLGASIGWAIGSALGSMLEPKKGQEGPRLTDLHIQNSQYGIMIPIAYGTVRIAGNVIWQTDLQEHKQTSGGKGGGPTVTTYTYTVSFAVMICEGPIVGITRIWANKRLRWSSVAANDFPFTLYRGTTTQLPDPAMEADKGVGNVSAHRGYAYIVFDDIPVEEFGNAIPSLEFEVVATGNVALQRVNDWEPDVPSDGSSLGYLRGIRFDGAYIYISSYGNGAALPPTYTEDKYTANGNFIENVFATTYQTSNPGGDFSLQINQVANSTAAAIVSHDPGNTSIKTYWFSGGLISSPELVGPPGSSGVSFIAYGNGFYFQDNIYCIGGSPTYVAKWDAPGGFANGQINAYYYLTDTVTQLPFGVDVTVDNDGKVWCIGTGSGSNFPPIWIFDTDLNLIANYASGSPGAFRYSAGFSTFTVYNDYLCLRLTTTLELWHYDGANFTLVDTYADTDVNAGGTLSLGGGYFLTNDGIFKIPSPVTHKSIVDDIDIRVGFALGDNDTTALTKLVNGAVIASQADARSFLEMLSTAYAADAVESGPSIKWVYKGAAPDESIPDDDLAAYEEGSECPPIIAQVRTQEVDLPRSVSVSYFDMNADYQIGTQLAKRETVHSTMETSIAFALVLTPKEGKEKADEIMYDAWTTRRRLSFSTPRKWSKLEPTDVKRAHGYTFRITQRDESQMGVLKFDAVVTRSQVFGQSGAAGVLIGSGGFTPPTPPGTGAPTDLLMLDLPLIGDGDYPNGYYAAMSGFSGSSNLYKSSDGGANYVSLLTSLTPDAVGVAMTALGDFGGGNVFDNLTSVTVRLNANVTDTLASATELAVLNGANEALIGSEIVQYKTATLTATRQYALTGLLRGRRGTEWAMATHVAGERFVVLPTSVNVDGPFAELGLTRLFKAVSAGTTLASATPVSFTNTGVALKPYAPVHLGGGRNAAGDITINWQRRTRKGGAWLDFIDSPLSEVTEEYQVVIYVDNTYVAAYNAYTVPGAQTYAYDAAAQTSDSGGLISPLYVGVKQIGSYGDGYEVRGII